MDQWFMENWYWLTVVAGVIYWAGRISAGVRYLKSDVDALKSDVGTLKSDVSVLKSDVEVLKADVSTLKSDVALLKEGLAEIKGRLTESFFDDIKTIALWIREEGSAGHHQAITQPKSPVALTEYGLALVDEIGGEQIAAPHVDQADKETQGMNPYEVQKYCFNYARDILEQLKRGDSDKYQELGDVAYRRGEAIERFARVIGVLLRDAVLAKRGVAPDNIGQCAPESASSP